MERALPLEYRETIAVLLAQLNKDNLSAAVAIASIPEEIRGYGHVKDGHLALARARQAKLLSDFKAGAVPGQMAG